MSITIKGVTSGGVDLKAPDTGSNTTVTLPSATGTLLPTDGNGSALTNLTSANLVGALPALSGANLTGLTSANLVGALPALDGSSLTGVAPTKATIDALGIAASSITGALPAIDGSSLTNMAAGGKVLQVVSTTGVGANLNAPTTESSIGLSLDITPQTGSYLLLFVTSKYHLVNLYGAAFYGYWFKDSTNIGQAFYVNQDQDGGNTDESAVSHTYYTNASFNGSTSFAFSVKVSQSGGYTRHGVYGECRLTAIEVGV
jgi:uncharacterized protein YjbI with pentapeptide repeats